MMTNLENLPKVSFGIVNCNRLYYLQSCLESLLECTSDYLNKEIIIVDNASVEEGTSEYLNEKESQGIKVFRQLERDPNNEFAKALNLIHKESSGEYVAMLQGDMQFILRGGWLQKYVSLFQSYEDDVGCIMFDAQRTITNQAHVYSNRIGVGSDGVCSIGTGGFGFVADLHRPPALGAADVMYSKKVLDRIGPWSESNSNHEHTGDSETKMIQKIIAIVRGYHLKWATYMSIYPPAVTIYTDARGTNARVRNDKRFGDYWPPKQDYKYYEIKDYVTEMSKGVVSRSTPVGIEEVAHGIEWSVPIDEAGNWKKNPIRIESALPTDYVMLYDNENESSKLETGDNNTDYNYLDEWLDNENR